MGATASHEDVPERVHWENDNERRECSKCARPFTVVRRRHHCRACGELCCSSCCVMGKADARGSLDDDAASAHSSGGDESDCGSDSTWYSSAADRKERKRKQLRRKRSRVVRRCLRCQYHISQQAKSRISPLMLPESVPSTSPHSTCASLSATATNQFLHSSFGSTRSPSGSGSSANPPSVSFCFSDPGIPENDGIRAIFLCEEEGESPVAGL